MLTKDAFIEFILNPAAVLQTNSTLDEEALPEGIEGFGAETAHPSVHTDASFARKLLEASGFGYPELVQRENVIRGGDDTVARYLPEQVCYWPKTPMRPYQTLLFETNVDHKELLSIPAFKGRLMDHLDIVEDALARFVSAALEGFQRGGESVTADVRKGTKKETLCVVSIVDKREGQPIHLVCFGTQNERTSGLETFQITEQTKFWDQQLAREHLALLYERQFKKLQTKDWQEAFTTTEERKQADKLLEICTQKAPKESDLQEGVLDLLDIIAKGFGLRKKPNTERRLVAYALPPDHDIGIDPEELESDFGGQNPFGGITLRDERSRLLGYIIYPLRTKSDAARLRMHLKENNRFHNVLLVYPDEEQASLELWQGKERLTGKLRKGQGYKDAADVVNLLSRFFVVSKANVKNPSELAEELAYRARYLRRLALKQLKEETVSGSLRNLYNGFKESLVHDQTEEEFADAFAQTLTYSLLTARWVANAQGATSGDRFSRKAAMQRLSIGSRFLSEMFSAALSMDLDVQRARLLWLVDDIADLLDRIDVALVFAHDEADLSADPIIHFYEPFLKAYDSTVRMQRGVFYTSRPVVSYIVREVDTILRRDFGLEDGLADITTWGDLVKRRGYIIPDGVSAKQAFVQVLDPATGTGTFLVEIIELIHRHMIAKWKSQGHDEQQLQALWNEYVPKHLLPRLHGYELLMAPYAIAHLKIGLKLHETGYRFGTDERARIYLTNTLEPAQDFSGRFEFAIPSLAHEAQAVNQVKQNCRFTVVVGNPPYSISSANTGAWITDLLARYKQAVRAERNIQPLSDDYVKFFRFAHDVIVKSQYGVIGYISNHTFLSGLIHRGMRESLTQDFDAISILDLHGSALIGLISPDGTKDENVFDIQQGVSITIARRLQSHNNSNPSVSFSELWGLRSYKYSKLLGNIDSSDATTLFPERPNFFFVPSAVRDEEYDSWPSLTEVFQTYAVGFETGRDEVLIGFSEEPIFRLAEALHDNSIPDAEIKNRFNIDDTSGWPVRARRAALASMPLTNLKQNVRLVMYRPFDHRFTLFCDFLRRASFKNMQHMLKPNIGLVAARMVKGEQPAHWYASRLPVEKILLSPKTSNNAVLFPLYQWSAEGAMELSSQRSSNLAPGFLTRLKSALGGSEQTEHLGLHEPEEVLYFAYAVFHSPAYRERYAEFLKIDFPRLPLPGSPDLFRDLARHGEYLIALHTMESPKLNDLRTTYFGPQGPTVSRVTWSEDTIWLHTTTGAKIPEAGFRGVPERVWQFHIGGYQVCEKWLKDRKGRKLGKEDIEHYQKVIFCLSETIRTMEEIDRVVEKYGGWPGAFTRHSAGVTHARI